MKKSQLLQFILTFFFGPIGLFYSSVAAALGFLIAAIAFGAFSGGFGAIAIWPIVIIVGVVAVSKHNRLVEVEEQRHQELLQATRQAGSGSPPEE